jgi:23S rRNA pseudouridine2605 synthase
MTKVPANKYARPAAKKSEFAGERIAKVLARVGVASRRDAEKMIVDGRVTVNGRKLSTPAFNVTDKDHISVDGKPIGEADPPRLWRYYKTAGLVTTERDPDGRPTVFQKLPAGLPRVNSVGRLDINTEGLLLFTNDGGLKRYLELPQTGWLRRYRVRAFDGQKGKSDDKRLIGQLEGLKKGITVEGVKYRSIEAAFERRVGGNVWITMALREGKNREIKKVLEHLNLKVNRLIRLSFGPFQLGQLEEGKIEEVPRRVLRQQLGKQWHELVDEENLKPEDESRPVRQLKAAGKTSGDARNGAKKPYRRVPGRVSSRPDSSDPKRRSAQGAGGKPGEQKSRDQKPRGQKPRGQKPRDGSSDARRRR